MNEIIEDIEFLQNLLSLIGKEEKITRYVIKKKIREKQDIVDQFEKELSPK